MKNFKKINDDELNMFLKNNKPDHPSAQAYEFEQILRQLDIKDEKTNFFTKISLGFVTAAFVGLCIFMLQSPSSSIINTSPVPNTTINAAAADDDDIDFVDSELPTMDIGENYLNLAGTF